MNDTIIQQNEIQKKPSHRKYIIAAGIILLLITPVFIFILLKHAQNPDPASEKIIREEAAAQLKKDPNELTDEDFTKITEFSLYGKKLCDIKLLEKFSNLQSLDIEQINYSPQNIPKWMTILARLHIFDLKKNLIDLKPLEKLQNLKMLNLSEIQVTNIEFLSGLINLRELDLASCSVHDIRPLKKLNKLRSLNLYDTKISDFEPIQQLNNLHILYIGRTQISDIKMIRRFENLERLNIDYIKTSDIDPIKELKHLKQLSMKDCPNITDQQVEDLQKALPNMKIIR